jgi:hypothetical protein
MQEIERHIFNDSQKYFKIKLDLFHELYADSLIAMGFPESKTSLLGVDFSTSNKYTEDEFQSILLDLTFEIPSITIDSFANKEKQSSCAIYYLNSQREIEGLYMIESIINYNSYGKTACKIYDLFTSNLIEINSHWL